MKRSTRTFTNEENDLIEKLCQEAGIAVKKPLQGYTLKEEERSLRIELPLSNQERRFGTSIAEIMWTDDDGIPAMATLCTDQYGNLYQLDVWKVNFSKVLNLSGWKQQDKVFRKVA